MVNEQIKKKFMKIYVNILIKNRDYGANREIFQSILSSNV